MILGPNLIYQCPSCDSLLESSSMISGNSFGAKRYSDGKVEARMMADPLNLTKCHGCQNFLWLSKLESIGEYELGESIPNQWRSAEYPESLSVYDYLDYLDSYELIERDEELWIRMRVLWMYNDPIRKGVGEFISSLEKVPWTKNIVRLLELVDWNKNENRLLAGELLRYLEDWGFAIEILDSINDPRLKKFGSEVVRKCLEKNGQVFQF